MMATIDYRRQDYIKASGKWRTMRDIIEGGSDSVKGAGQLYLPKLGGQDSESYSAYNQRAIFYNATGRSFDAAIGQLFRRKPEYSVVNDLINDVNLSGTDLFYFCKDIAAEVATVNRVGVLVDYSDEQDRPYITRYFAENIINWQTGRVDGKDQLTMIVIEGINQVRDPDDKYKTIDQKMWKVLEIEEGIYVSRDYIQDQDSYRLVAESYPKINGKYFSFIPFYFISTYGNDPTIYQPIFSELANINLGHYKNSADYENMLHWCGAKTIITRNWDTSLPFPIGAVAMFTGLDTDAKFLEASSDSALLEELRHKEEQMSVLGSQIISGKGRYVQSAETARISAAGEVATLADIATSLSQSMTEILGLMFEWAGISDDPTVSFNTNFETDEMSPEEAIQWMAIVQSGYLSNKVFNNIMRKRGVYPANWTDDLEAAEIEKDKERNKINLGLAIPDEL